MAENAVQTLSASTSGNVALAASFLSYALGTPPAPGDLTHPPLTFRQITGRGSDKFAMGYLGGVGGGSQFQGVGSLLPVLPPASNRDFEARNRESRGTDTGEHLMTRYERPQNFNPGVGTDTWREGENVTWTMYERGELPDPTTGIRAPLAYPQQDRTTRNAIPRFVSTGQGLAPVTTAPVVLVAGITGFQAGMSLAEIQKAAASIHTRNRLKRGLITRHHAERK
jgi:hypothetical protein